MASIDKNATVTGTVIYVTRQGDWLPHEELLAVALSAVNAEGSLTVHLGGVDHLDAGALQILLALAKERKQQGGSMIVAEASPPLARWFEYAGASGNISTQHEE